MRVIVCGGRKYRDTAAVTFALEDLPRDAVIVHGDAPGADRIADQEAQAQGRPVDPFPADWDRYHKAAGPIRNQAMLDAGADLVIAFPGGRGTADMVRRARKAGVPVREIA